MKTTFNYGARPLDSDTDPLRRQLHLAARFRDMLVAIELERRERRWTLGSDASETDKEALAEWTKSEIKKTKDAAGWEPDGAGGYKSLLHHGTIAAVLTSHRRMCTDVWDFPARTPGRCGRCKEDEWKEVTKNDGTKQTIRFGTPFAAGDRIWLARGAHRVIGCPNCGPGLRFLPFDGTGRFQCQLLLDPARAREQRTAKQNDQTYDQVLGCSVLAFLAREHGQAWFEEDDGQHRTLVLRVGSLDSSGRQPLYAKIKVNYHRDLPLHAAIKFLRVNCWKIAGQECWSVQFVLESKSNLVPLKEKPSRESVGVNFGWRIFPDRVRVAMLVDNKGRTQELSLPVEWIRRAEYAEELRSTADRIKRNMQDELLVARGEVAQARAPWPEWLLTASKGCHLWQSPLRFDKLGRDLEAHLPEKAKALTRSGDGSGRIHRKGPAGHGADGKRAAQDRIMRIARIAADGGAPAAVVTVWQLVETWRVAWRHLYVWECHQRQGALNARQYRYYEFARQVARYDTVRIPKLDFRVFAEVPQVSFDEAQLPGEPPKPKPKRDHPITAAARPRRFKVALSTLREAMHGAVMRAGGCWEEIDPVLTTQTCHLCGKEERFDAKLTEEIIHKCSHCGRSWDQDENGAINTLRAPAERLLSSRRSKDEDAENEAKKAVRLKRLNAGKKKPGDEAGDSRTDNK